jgi:hypothetical protein
MLNYKQALRLFYLDPHPIYIIIRPFSLNLITNRPLTT